MPRARALPTSDCRQVLLETFAVNERINQLILGNLDPRAWQAKPSSGNARTIAAIFTHMQNMRRKWLRLSAPTLKLPAELDRSRCTQRQAKTALAESAELCSKMIAEALAGADGGMKQFLRDGWARPWPAGIAMVVYMITHEAHHRGQVCLLAHQLGFPLPVKARSGMWVWERLWKECGFAGPH
jgi:uncharacterized damage-inducible protein DinB